MIAAQFSILYCVGYFPNKDFVTSKQKNEKQKNRNNPKQQP